MGGFPKGLLEHPRVPEKTLVGNWVGIADCLSLPRVLVGHNPAYAGFDLPVLPDRPSGVGPIGGLNALLEYCEARSAHALAVACDMPFASVALVQRLCRSEPQAHVVAPYSAQGSLWEPLFARYDPKSILAPLALQLASQRHSLQGLVQVVGGTPLPMTSEEWSELEDWDEPDAIANGKPTL